MPQQGHRSREGKTIISSEVLLENHKLQILIIKIHSSWNGKAAHLIKPKNPKLVQNPSHLKKHIKAITSIQILELLRALEVKIHLNSSRINIKPPPVALWLGYKVVHVILESRNLGHHVILEGRQQQSLRQESIETSKRSMEAAQKHKIRHQKALPAEVMFRVLQQLLTQREFQNLRSRIWVPRCTKTLKISKV